MHLVRRSEVKQVRQRSASKEVTSNNRGRQICSKQARHNRILRRPGTRQASVPKNALRRRSKPPTTKTWGREIRRNEGQRTLRIRQASIPGILKESEAQQTRLYLKYSTWYHGRESSEIKNWRCWTMHLIKIKRPRQMLEKLGDRTHPN